MHLGVEHYKVHKVLCKFLKSSFFQGLSILNLKHWLRMYKYWYVCVCVCVPRVHDKEPRNIKYLKINNVPAVWSVLSCGQRFSYTSCWAVFSPCYRNLGTMIHESCGFVMSLWRSVCTPVCAFVMTYVTGVAQKLEMCQCNIVSFIPRHL